MKFQTGQKVILELEGVFNDKTGVIRLESMKGGQEGWVNPSRLVRLIPMQIELPSAPDGWEWDTGVPRILIARLTSEQKNLRVALHHTGCISAIAYDFGDVGTPIIPIPVTVALATLWERWQ